MSARYVMHHDPGHGWLAVPKAEVVASGCRVSPYSYVSRDGATVYLEEDCDASSFLEAAGLVVNDALVAGVEVRDEYHRGDCFVQSLRSWSQNWTERVRS